MSPADAASARAFAEAWVAAWNARDVEAVLVHFREDARFLSARAAEVTGSPSLEGKAALRAYWVTAAQRLGETVLELDRALWDPEARELLILFDRVSGSTRTRQCELLCFDTAGLAFDGEALYGAAVSG